MKNKSHIEPTPGYILTIPYIQKDKTFTSVKESGGEDQKSEVIAVGKNVKDAAGELRESPCKVGDIIIHAATNKDFEIDFTKYRIVHFTEVHGIWNIK